MALSLLYHTCQLVLAPVEWLWAKCFSINKWVNLAGVRKMVMVGAVGGEGKTTAAARLCQATGYRHVSIDKCKFGPDWERFTDDQFKANVDAQLAVLRNGVGGYVVDGAFSDPKCPAQQLVMQDLMRSADIVVWNDIPKWVAVWRKAFRSFKRYIGVEPQGVAPETWAGVWHMLKRTAREYDDRRQLLLHFWTATLARGHCFTVTDYNHYHRAIWPFYYKGYAA